MSKLRYRGSRKHVLDWTGKASFLAELTDLVDPAPVQCNENTRFMPIGHEKPGEARLERFGPTWLANAGVWEVLRDWWLIHKKGANTPNWDIAVGCVIDGRPGLVLVEAKANWPEFSTAKKPLSRNPSGKSRENHERIGSAIDEACAGWGSIDKRVLISRDSHYQLANRLAFAWKVATLGVPTVLVYLGFTGDEGIRDAGLPFADDADWKRAFALYASGVVPLELFERRLDLGNAPVWLLVRSRPVIESSPPRDAGPG